MIPRVSPHLAAVRCFACDHPDDPRALLGVCTKCGLPLPRRGVVSRESRARGMLAAVTVAHTAQVIPAPKTGPLRRARHDRIMELKNLAPPVVDKVGKLRAWYGARHEAFTVAQAAQAARVSHETARRLCAVEANVGKLRRLSEGVYVRAA